MHSLAHLAAHVPFTLDSSLGVNPNPAARRCSASYASTPLEHALRQAGTQAGSISSVVVMAPCTTRSTQNLDRTAGVEVDAYDPVVAPTCATAALVGPPEVGSLHHVITYHQSPLTPSFTHSFIHSFTHSFIHFTRRST